MNQETIDNHLATENPEGPGSGSEEKTEEKRKPTWQESLFEWLDLLTPVLAFAALFCTFLGMVFGVSGSSMYPTLHHKDIMFIQRAFYTPEPGDIVVLRKDGFPSEGQSEAIVKRVIATAGQTVRVDFEENRVYVDGVALDESYINQSTDWPDPVTGEMESHDWLEGDIIAADDGMIYTDIVVPEGCIFVMGDNRNGSTDSRDYRLGPVDERCVLGRARLVFFPFSRFHFLE